MNDDKIGDRYLLERAKSALRDKDQDQAAPILFQIAERGAALAKMKVAHDVA